MPFDVILHLEGSWVLSGLSHSAGSERSGFECSRLGLLRRTVPLEASQVKSQDEG